LGVRVIGGIVMKIGMNIKRALLLLLAMTVLCGGLYTLAVTGVAQLIFPRQANGSIIQDGDKSIGSELIGQNFTDPKYFWGRPSATADYPYNALAGAGSNKAVTGDDAARRVQERIDYLKAADPGNTASVPVELVTASASGLDPDISPNAAKYQASRAAKTRKIAVDDVMKLIADNTEGRFLWVFGEERVNVLKLNIALDKLTNQ
jgi:potassium-transporting ATPase KdpC subunit